MLWSWILSICSYIFTWVIFFFFFATFLTVAKIAQKVFLGLTLLSCAFVFTHPVAQGSTRKQWSSWRPCCLSFNKDEIKIYIDKIQCRPLLYWDMYVNAWTPVWTVCGDDFPPYLYTQYILTGIEELRIIPQGYCMGINVVTGRSF